MCSCMDAGRENTARLPAFNRDYDGTLTPIVNRPEEAYLPPATEVVIRRLSRSCKLAIITGRSYEQVNTQLSAAYAVWSTELLPRTRFVLLSSFLESTSRRVTVSTCVVAAVIHLQSSQQAISSLPLMKHAEC